MFVPVLLLAAGDERLLRLMQLIAQTLQAGGDLRFGAVAVRVDAACEASRPSAAGAFRDRLWSMPSSASRSLPDAAR